MDSSLRKKILAANRIHAQMLILEKQRYQSLLTRLEHLLDTIGDYRTNYNKLKMSLQKNWMYSARQVALRNLRKGDNIYHDICEIRQKIEYCSGDIPPASEIYAELVQAENEFEGFEIDDNSSTVSVETQAVELEDIYLGRFKVKLYISRIGSHPRGELYKVIALEPHPPCCNQSVTHPHVRDDYLCEGEAAEAISAALAGGRICDFFTIVNSVLNTYNSGSPYVSLDDWQGEACNDCGSYISGDDRYYCGSCDSDYCDRCSAYCHICDETTCLGCLTECCICGERVCQSCLKKCPDCDEVLCVTCLKENMCKCNQNLEENENDSEEIDPDNQRQTSPKITADNPGEAA